MPTLDTIRNLTVRGQSQGLDRVKADLDAVSAAQGRVATSAERMATVTDMSSRRQLSAAAALERLAASHDATYRAQQQHARGTAILERATAQGLSGTKEFAIAQAALNKLHHEAGSAVGFNRMQMMEATHVAKSFFDEIAAGSSPLRALQVEGGRIAQIFTEGQGGVGGTFRALGGLLGRLVFGWVGLTLAIGGTAVAAGAAVVLFENAQARMQRALEGTGRASGMTVSQLNAAALAGGHAGYVFGGQARDLASGFAQAGFGQGLTTSLVAGTKRYGEFTEAGTDEAGKRLAAAFADPERGAVELDKRLGFLNDRLSQTIHNYEASGDLESARNALLGEFNKAMVATTSSAWGFSKWWNSQNDKWTQAVYDAAGAVDRLVFRSRTGLAKPPDQVAAEKHDFDANAMSKQAGPIVRAILPDLVRAQDAANNLNVLRQALSDPLVLSKMGADRGDVNRAYGNLTVQSANADPLRRMKQDYDMAIAAADAFSTAEKGAIEARRAELQVLRDTGDVSRAAAAAQMAMNEAIAKANSEAEDRLDKAKQDAAMVGLSPYQAGRQRIVNEFEGVGGLFAKDAASKSDIADAMAPVKADLASAGHLLADAVRGIAASITPSAGAYGALKPFTSNVAGAPLSGGFAASVDRTLGFEGGLNRRDTNGTPSNFGINQAANPGLDVTSLTADQAKGVYKRDYWDKIGADSMAPAMARVAFDTAVMEGVGQALKLAGQSGGDANRMLDLRQNFESSLLAKDPSRYGQYQKSWALRDASLRADISGAPGVANDNLRPMTIHAGKTIAPLASTALGSDRQTEATRLAAYDQAQALGPIKAANDALVSQRAALEATISTWGQSSDKIAAAAEKQKLINDYTQQGIPLSAGLRAQIDTTAQGYGDLAKATDDFHKRQQDIVGAMDDFRGASKGALSSFVGDMMAGKSATQGLHDALSSVASKLAGKAEDSLIDGLFGKSGSSGFGMFGNFLGGGLPKFATGTDFAPGGWSLVGERGPEIVKLPTGSQVTPNDQLGGGGDIHLHTHVDARGAQVGVADQIASAIAQNNTRLPGMLSDAQRRAS